MGRDQPVGVEHGGRARQALRATSLVALPLVLACVALGLIAYGVNRLAFARIRAHQVETHVEKSVQRLRSGLQGLRQTTELHAFAHSATALGAAADVVIVDRDSGQIIASSMVERGELASAEALELGAKAAVQAWRNAPAHQPRFSGTDKRPWIALEAPTQMGPTGRSAVALVRLLPKTEADYGLLETWQLVQGLGTTLALCVVAFWLVRRSIVSPLLRLERSLASSGRLTRPDRCDPAAPREIENLRRAFMTQLDARFAAENALRQREEIWRAVTESAPLGILVMDWIGKCSVANQELCRILCLPMEECLGAGWLRAIHPDDRDRLLAELFGAGQEEGQISELVRVARDGGRWAWVEVRTQAVAATDELGGFVATVSDVDDRVASLDRQRSLLNSCQDGLLFIQHGVILDANHAAVRLLGWEDAGELIGTQVPGLSPSVQPDGRQSLEKGAEMIAIAQREGWHRFHWTHQRRDGEDIEVEVTLYDVRGGQGDEMTACLRPAIHVEGARFAAA